MIRKKLNKEKYREWLKNASINDLMARIALIKPTKTIKSVNFWTSEIGNFLTNVQIFLRNPAKYPEDDLVRLLFADVMRRPHVVRFVKYMESQIVTALSRDLMSMIRDSIRQLWGRPIDFNDPNFLAWIVIFVMAGWELTKRLELVNNPAEFNINNSTALSYYYSKKNSADSNRVKELNRQALGINEDEELRKMLINDAMRISKSIKLKDLEKESTIQKIFFRELEKRIEKHLTNLRGDELRAMAWGKENNFIYLPNTVRKRAIDKLLKQLPRTRKLKERLRKQGMSEEEIKRRIRQEWQNYYGLEFPDSFEENPQKGKIERTVEFAKREIGNEVRVIIVEYTKHLPPQANPQKRLGEFLIEKIEADGIEKYVRDKGRFQIKEIHNDSGISLRTVERFCKGLRKYARQNYNPIY